MSYAAYLEKGVCYKISVGKWSIDNDLTIFFSVKDCSNFERNNYLEREKISKKKERNENDKIN